MDIVLTGLRFFVFLLSVLGYVLVIRIKLNITEKSSWIFVFATIGCTVYFAGLLHVLLYAVILIFAGGIGLFLWFAIKKQLSAVFHLRALNILNIAFCIAIGVIFASLVDTNYIHYDNFSHWGLVVKYLLMYNAFPDASSAIIDFKTYPLGTSALIYYFCRIAGQSQGVMLLGQALPLFACFYAMFGVIRDTKRMLLVGLLGLCCSTMTFFNISIRINNLLVDFLLPLLALSALASMFACRRNFKMACLTSVPMLALLLVSKNSGIFFAVICYIYLLSLAPGAKKQQPKYPKQNKFIHLRKGFRLPAPILGLLTIAASLTTLAMWDYHTSTVFQGELTKHTMSAENFSSVYGQKTPQVISNIIHNFLNAVFSLDSLSTKGILLFNVLALGAFLVARLMFKKRWNLWKWLVALDLAVLLYYIGILAMFLFTMPTAEALILAGFERYASSMVVFFIGALAICTVNDVENSFYVQQGEKRNYMAFKSLSTKNAYEFATTAFVGLTVVVLLSEVNGMNSMKLSYADSIPAQVEALVGDNWSQTNNQKYLFYATDTDSQISDYYLQYVGKYFLFSPNVDAVDTLDPDTFQNTLSQYDYLVVVEEDGAISDFIHSHQSTERTATVVGVYRVDDLF